MRKMRFKRVLWNLFKVILREGCERGYLRINFENLGKFI